MHLSAWLLFALLALLLWGVSGITQKLATNAISTELCFLWFAYAMIAMALIILVSTPLDWRVKPVAFCLAAIGGAVNGLGVMASFAALERGGQASVVIPLTCLYPLVTIGLAFAFLHETLTGPQMLGVALAILATVLLSREEPLEQGDRGSALQ
jgi:bacterial/archaeal transporter family protein